MAVRAVMPCSPARRWGSEQDQVIAKPAGALPGGRPALLLVAGRLRIHKARMPRSKPGRDHRVECSAPPPSAAIHPPLA